MSHVDESASEGSKRMRVTDLRETRDLLERNADVCVIGSGPAGMTTASELARKGHSVIVLETGGEAPDREELNRVRNVGMSRIEDQSLVRARALGGTSCIWSGRCVPLDPIDFERRHWIGASGWPIAPDDLESYYMRAAEYLQLGPQHYGDELWSLLRLKAPTVGLDPALLRPRFWHYSRSRTDPAVPTRFARDVDAPFEVILHATATRIEATGARVTAVRVADTEGASGRISASVFVVAGGSIETPRLLLASGLGNDNTGRYFMDHVGTTVAEVPSDDAIVRERFGMYWKRSSPHRLAFVHGVGLAPEIQRREKLLNAAAWLEEFPSQRDPWQAGVRIARRLGARPPAAHIASVEFWRARGGPASKPAPTLLGDIRAVLGHPLLLLQGIRRMLRHRPPLYLADRIDLYALVEQVPDPASRITLSDERDALGVPIAEVDWRVHDLEYETTRRLAEIITAEFERLGLPAPVPTPWMSDVAAWREHVLDRAHQLGSMRMAHDEAMGAVDPDCRVFGTDNLYIAGSSVFPTGGHANPTFTIIALAIRLAEHIAERQAVRAPDGVSRASRS